MKYIIVTIIEGKVVFVSQAETQRGAAMSANHSRNLCGHSAIVKILSLADILAWDETGLSELEAMFKL